MVNTPNNIDSYPFVNRDLLSQRKYITQRPKVSLIIPTLNEGKNLPLVLPLIPKDWVDEVILVDGRSTDRTIDIALKIDPTINFQTNLSHLSLDFFVDEH